MARPRWDLLLAAWAAVGLSGLHRLDTPDSDPFCPGQEPGLVLQGRCALAARRTLARPVLPRWCSPTSAWHAHKLALGR